MIWLKNAPKLDPSNLYESEKQIIQFVNRFVTCTNDESNPYVCCQCHIHTHTCLKKLKVDNCRFGIPLPMMPETMILYSLDIEERVKSNKKFVVGKLNYEIIRKFMNELYKHPRDITFEQALVELKMSQADYIYAIKTSLKSAKIFLKRGSMDVGINGYHRDILNLWEANMDIQFVLDEFAVAAYILNYMNKSTHHHSDGVL